MSFKVLSRKDAEITLNRAQSDLDVDLCPNLKVPKSTFPYHSLATFYLGEQQGCEALHS